MTRAEFLDTLRRRLRRPATRRRSTSCIDDYASHFAEGMAAGRSEAEIAAALGDPMRLARELRAEAGLRRWETARTPAQLLRRAVRLPGADRGRLHVPAAAAGWRSRCSTLIAGHRRAGALRRGHRAAGETVQLGHGLFTRHSLARNLSGIGLLGVGIGGGALLLMMVDYVVRLLGKFARLHYALLESSG